MGDKNETCVNGVDKCKKKSYIMACAALIQDFFFHLEINQLSVCVMCNVKQKDLSRLIEQNKLLEDLNPGLKRNSNSNNNNVKLGIKVHERGGRGDFKSEVNNNVNQRFSRYNKKLNSLENYN